MRWSVRLLWVLPGNFRMKAEKRLRATQDQDTTYVLFLTPGHVCLTMRPPIH